MQLTQQQEYTEEPREHGERRSQRASGLQVASCQLPAGFACCLLPLRRNAMQNNNKIMLAATDKLPARLQLTSKGKIYFFVHCAGIAIPLKLEEAYRAWGAVEVPRTG